MGLKDIAYRFTPSPLRNYWFPVPDQNTKGGKVRQENARNFNQYALPLQLQRLRHDIQMWREAVNEAERAYFPYRVKMQRMYQDTVLNDHVRACITKRKNLSLLKEFMICDKNGKENEEATKLLKGQWFYELMGYVLDAQFFGYSLVELKDFINNSFPELSVVRRHNITVDYRVMESGDPYYGAFPYAPDGIHFTDPEARDENGISYWDWIVWAKTPSDIGTSSVGFGLLYYVAKNEIFLRNNLGFNADYVEIFGMPLRWGKTDKQEDDGTGERSRFEQALRSMGSAGYIITDPDDEIQLLKGEGAGRGNEVYSNLEERLQKGISKILLGHADALESTPGKLGSQGNDNDGAGKALREVETTDIRFLEAIINDQVLPKIINIGLNIPLGLQFRFKNNEEKQEIREREDASNKVTADIAQVMKNAGLKMDAKYFTERTGIPCEAIEENIPEEDEPGLNKFGKDIKNKINGLY